MFKKLDGFKTIIGGLLFILLAILALASCFLPELQMNMVEKALDFFALGFSTLGIGGKLQKVISLKIEEKNLINELKDIQNKE